MISKPIKGILEEFDNIFEKLKSTPDTKHHLEKVSGDVSYLKLWRDELESGKQSIFILGKMSSGKSTFLNFLLDISNKKDDMIFKTATSTETGIIQTLEHCNSKSESFAKISIKNLSEFKKLTFPPSISYENQGDIFSIPLDNSEQIVFFRDKIIAKSKDNSFDTIEAISQVDVKYPLKYFKNFKIIDTPGLGAHKEKNKKGNKEDDKDTDKTVRANYHGKSHVFWFLDASNKEMAGNLTLLDEEKELLKINSERIHFIANKYDEQILDDDGETIYDKKSNAKRMEELGLKIKTTLDKTVKIKSEKPSIIFTSFKNPSSYKRYYSTISNIKKLEEHLLLQKKNTSYNNVSSLIAYMKPILEKLKKYVVEEGKQKSDKMISDLNYQKKRIEKEYKIIQDKKADTFKVINKCMVEIKSVKKDKNLNTHERYNTYIKSLKEVINNSVRKIENSLVRINQVSECDKVYDHLNYFKYLKDLSLKEKESWWKKYIDDSELDEKKKILENYISIKISELKSLEELLEKCLENYHLDSINEISEKISRLEESKKNIEKNSQIVNRIKFKVNNINSLLLKDLEVKISEWNPCPKNENSSLCSFLQLYSLLEEHELVMNKIN